MSFKKRAATTGKLMIPDGARKEVELLYLNEIVSIVEKHHLNLDQIPSKFVQSSPHTMRQKGSSNVEIVGSGDKRSTTATFVVMLVGKFLPMQLIYDVNFHVNTLSSTLLILTSLSKLSTKYLLRISNLKEKSWDWMEDFQPYWFQMFSKVKYPMK